MTANHYGSDRADDDTHVDRKDRREGLRRAVERLQRERAALPSRGGVDQCSNTETLKAFIGCQHTLSDVLRLVVKIGARPDLRRAEVLAFDEALYICIDVHLYLDDLYSELLRRSEPTAMTSALDNLVDDGAVPTGISAVKEES